MSINITLNPVADLTNTTTAQTTINTNSATITSALTDALSLTGQTPNQMHASIDMNSNRILNVATAINAGDAVNLQALSTITGGGKVSNIPTGGTTGQLLAKTSNADFALGYVNPANVTAGTNINVASGVISTVTNPVFTTVNGNTLTTGTGTLTLAAGKTLNTQNSLTLAGTDGTTQTFPSTSGTLLSSTSSVGGDLTGSLPNPTIGTNIVTNAKAAQMGAFTLKGNPTGSTTNSQDFTINGLTQKVTPVGADMLLVVDSAASNALKFATVSSVGTSSGVSSIAGNTGAFTLTNGITNSTNAIQINAGAVPGVANNSNASAGNVGEYISSTVSVGGAVTLTNNTPSNITSISLTAGDWDVSGTMAITPTGNTTVFAGSISTTSNTLPTAPNNGAFFQFTSSATIIPGGSYFQPTGTMRLSLSTTTTVYLVGQCNFSSGSATAYGFIGARRMR